MLLTFGRCGRPELILTVGAVMHRSFTYAFCKCVGTVPGLIYVELPMPTRYSPSQEASGSNVSCVMAGTGHTSPR